MGLWTIMPVTAAIRVKNGFEAAPIWGQQYMKNRLLILGSRQHAKVLVAIARECYAERYDIVGYLNDDPDLLHSKVLGLSILGPFAELPDTIREHQITHVGIGVSNRFMTDRDMLFRSILELGCQVPSMIHDRAFVSPFASIGQGVTLNPGVVVNAYAQVGDNTVVYSNTTIEHETVLSNNVYVGPGVNFSSNAHVGPNTFIGAGAKIIPDIHIGNNVAVGAGSVIIHDIPDNVTVAGIPATIINQRAKGSLKNNFTL
ncbi:MAG: acetyltransferase [Planctomycetes bacterium]|nr:acetyltransferase [Planctomycetota bacterium]